MGGGLRCVRTFSHDNPGRKANVLGFCGSGGVYQDALQKKCCRRVAFAAFSNA